MRNCKQMQGCMKNKRDVMPWRAVAEPVAHVITLVQPVFAIRE